MEGARTVPTVSIRQAIDRLAFQLHKRLLFLQLQPLLERLNAIICTHPWQRADAHQLPPLSGSMTMGSPTVKCGRRIESPPSNSFSIIRGVPRAIDVVYCRGVTGCLRLHYSCFWECPKTRACWGKFLRHWAGPTSCVFSRYFGNCTDRQAPEILVLQWS